MIHYYIQKHREMRNQIVQRRALHLHENKKLNKELAVLSRTSIVATQRKVSAVPTMCKSKLSDSTQLSLLDAHYARMKFVNVTLARFTQKCSKEHEKMISKRGRDLGIFTFYKWKRVCYIKRRLRELIDNSDESCMRMKYNTWKDTHRQVSNARRYIYSTVRSKHIFLVNRNTKRLCILIWQSYTERVVLFRKNLWKRALRFHKMYKYILEWRVVCVRMMNMRKFIRASLASLRDRLFLKWKELAKRQISIRRQFIKKWQLRKASIIIEKWKRRYTAGCIVSLNLHRFYHGNQGRIRYKSLERKILAKEDRRHITESKYVDNYDDWMNVQLTVYLTKTLRGRFMVSRLASIIQKECKKVIESAMGKKTPFLRFHTFYQSCLKLVNVSEEQQNQIQLAMKSLNVIDQLDDAVIVKKYKYSRVLQVCWRNQWSFNLARSSILEAGHKYVIRKCRLKFRQENGKPPWLCNFCTEGFALHYQKLEHEKINCCCWRVHANNNKTLRTARELEEKEEKEDKIIDVYVETILMKFLSLKSSVDSWAQIDRMSIR